MGKLLMCKRQEKRRQHEYLREEGDGVHRTLTITWDDCSIDSGTVKNGSISTASTSAVFV